MRTKEEFKKEYCNKIGITERFFDKKYVVMGCSCVKGECPGLVVVNNDKESVKRHERLEKMRKEIEWKI